ncbi:hypothetical protein RHMOL_Rhmol05G0070800 [Rhododendron molle]|uniref:Uncharacterized protein n=1 Tax=Rhododendron molle TaxID=49168 RepID=A0ACC0NLD9_RHOML|nr:hypothetical protein RHMOL_Rhmol05G0070800 [Rhododendron molle]
MLQKTLSDLQSKNGKDDTMPPANATQAYQPPAYINALSGVEGGPDLGEDNDDQTEAEGEGNTVGKEIRNEIGTQVEPLPQNMDKHGPFPRAMPIFPGLDSSGSKRKTSSSGTDAISMNNILRNMAKKKQYKSVVKHRYNMADVMRVVSQMEYFKDPPPPVYWWLLDHLAKDPMKLEIFVGLQNDLQRFYFIQRHHTKALMLANGQFNIVQRNMNQYKSVVKHRYNMTDVMMVLSQMEYFKGPTPTVYWWLIDHLAEDPTKMQIFVGLQNDAQRISLIQREHTKAMILANRQFNPYGIPPPFDPPPRFNRLVAEQPNSVLDRVEVVQRIFFYKIIQGEAYCKVDDEKRVKEAEAAEGRYLDVGFTLYRVRFEVIEKRKELYVTRSAIGNDL